MNFSSGGSDSTISEPAHLAILTFSVVIDFYWSLQILGSPRVITICSPGDHYTFFNSASIITNCQYATMNKSNITIYVTLHSPFFWVVLLCLNFLSVPIVFHQFFTWIVVGYIDLRFSLVVRKASDVEEETKWAV